MQGRKNCTWNRQVKVGVKISVRAISLDSRCWNTGPPTSWNFREQNDCNGSKMIATPTNWTWFKKFRGGIPLLVAGLLKHAFFHQQCWCRCGTHQAVNFSGKMLKRVPKLSLRITTMCRFFNYKFFRAGLSFRRFRFHHQLSA